MAQLFASINDVIVSIEQEAEEALKTLPSDMNSKLSERDRREIATNRRGYVAALQATATRLRETYIGPSMREAVSLIDIA